MSRLKGGYRWLVYGLGIVAPLLFIGLAALMGKPGFPLDDAWIHQTYARNLASNGRLEYISGVVSAGSTSPLWTLLLTLGYLLHIPYLWWAYGLGIASLLLLLWAGMRLWRQLWPEYAKKDWLAGMILATCWPLLWAATSGMETLLFIALGLTLLALFNSQVSPFIIGFLSGLLILIRPDGLILLLLLLGGLFLQGRNWQGRVKATAVALLFALLPLIPYIVFNWTTSATIWPNTFYAKQTEYAMLLEQPIISRALQLLYFSLGGAPDGWRGLSAVHLLLFPGLIVAIGLGFKKIKGQRLKISAQSLIANLQSSIFYWLPLLWALGHVILYAWRLPVTYQHGRYLFVAMPIWILYGVAGWVWIYGRMGNGRYARLSKLATTLIFILLLLFFVVLGGQAYANDVAFIEGEMVAVAHWVADNTPPDTLIAAHDIGAIGYFAQRPLLDLAGLITPEIIPYLSDDQAMADYILQSNADYLVTAPGWPYTLVTNVSDVTLQYQTGYLWTQEQGLNNMAVYQLP